MNTRKIVAVLGLFIFGLSCSYALDIPEKHEQDHREYRRFTLDNGLKVLLVSDPEMNTSAASMAVGVGSLADPRERQGLAHFLEHMLFLGTKKFPEVEEYSKYLKTNGGYSNAYTAGDHTNYHFMIHHDALEGALERFSQFFISPLFNPEFTDRELKAVHNEHQKNLENDNWREYFLMNRFFIKEHPAHHFGTGNSETLNGVDRNELLSFYEQHYSADNMALTLLSKKGLDSLEDMVRAYFQEVPNRKIKTVKYAEKYLDLSEKMRVVTMKPVKDLRSLKLMFALPGLDGYFLSKPGELIGFILGHEGQSSLLSLLKKEDLAIGLGAGSYGDSADFASFSITVDLTEKGAENYETVAEYCFAAIKMVKEIGYQDHIYEELRTMNKLDQVYSNKGEGTGLAMNLTSNMLRYPIEYAEKLRWSLGEKNTEIYTKILSYLEPKNCIMLLTLTDAKTDSIEPIYGTEYSYKESAELYKKLSEVNLNPDIKGPQANPFLPERATPLSERPVLLLNEPGLSFWYSQDVEFKRPKAQMMTRFRFPRASVNIHFITKMDLFTTLVNEQLNEWSYPAAQAGLNYRLGTDSELEGMDLIIGGYDSGLPKLMDQLIVELKSIHLSKERFTSLKNEMLRSLKNFNKEGAYHQARVFSRKISRGTYFAPNDKYSVLESLTYEMMQQFPKELFSQLYIESLVHGNVDAEQAKQWIRKLQSALVEKPLARKDAQQQSYLQQTKFQLQFAKVLETNNDCLRKDFYLGADSPKMRMISQVLGNFIEQPFYTEMRTRQQLGYIVWGGTAASPVDHFIIFIIQSGTHDVLDIQKRANDFIPTLLDSFAKLSETEFNELKQAVKAKLEEKPKSIAGKANQFFADIFENNQDFERKNSELAALKILNKADVETTLKLALSDETAKAQDLLFFSEGKAIPEEIKTKLEDIDVVRKNSVYTTKP